MGFGKKTDYKSGRTLDLDASYKGMIKPAVEDAGLTCIRADEIVHSGVIDVPMYEQLLTADVVVADLSTANANAFYELGVRHALRPHTTIAIAETGLEYPFDVNHTVIRRYKHLGEDVGVAEARRFHDELVSAICAILAKPTDDSPVYTYLSTLQPPVLRNPPPQAPGAPVAAAASAPGGAPPPGTETLRVLMDAAEAARKAGDWTKCKIMLAMIRQQMQKKNTEGNGPDVDPYIIQQLALATYKADNSVEALKEAHNILSALAPEASNDPETLGLWGAIHKRLWDKTTDRNYLDQAIAAYDKGFSVKSDYYNGINVAYLLDLRASISEGDDAIADRVQAKRIRRQVIPTAEKLSLEEDLKPEQRYWLVATVAEGYCGIGDEAKYQEWIAKANQVAPESWMIDSTREQIERLRALQATSSAAAV
jgi:hypothetical protein